MLQQDHGPRELLSPHASVVAPSRRLGFELDDVADYGATREGQANKPSKARTTANWELLQSLACLTTGPEGEHPPATTRTGFRWVRVVA